MIVKVWHINKELFHKLWSIWSFLFIWSSIRPEQECAIIRSNSLVVFWASIGKFLVNGTKGVFYELIAFGSNFTCGLKVSNFSVVSVVCRCFDWPPIVSGSCVQSSCSGWMIWWRMGYGWGVLYPWKPSANWSEVLLLLLIWRCGVWVAVTTR